MNEYEIMIKNLENRVTELEIRTQCGGASTLTVRKWQPKGGNWRISCLEIAEKAEVSAEGVRLFGKERQTEEQAQRAVVEMRRFNRLLALRDELCGDEILSWIDNDEEKYYVYFSHERRAWYVSSDDFGESIQPYFRNENVAQKACDMLNSGEAEL